MNNSLYKWRGFSVVTQLLILNVVFFLVCNVVSNLFFPALYGYFMMPASLAELPARFYTPVTYMFTHAQLGHAFFNMVYLYFMGEIFASIVGEKRLWFVYLGGGLAGAALFLLFSTVFGMGGYLLGASAAVTAVSIVCAMYAPDLPVSLFFFGSFKLKWVVLAMFLVSTVLDLSVNTGGKIAHLGGALFGLLYGLQLRKGNDLRDLFHLRKKSTKAKIIKMPRISSEEKTLDELLDKINRSGYESLSKSERETLQKISSRK